jgi:hypothetical protein
LEAEEIFARFFFIAFLNSPCYETPKNAIKKNRTKQPRVKKKKTEEKKAAFFVMSPDGFFRKKVFFCVFELPLLRNASCSRWLAPPTGGTNAGIGSVRK